MIVTFYSYKGGVGRSMALANVAQWLYLQGARVVMIDWDLEAPGLETYFYQEPRDLEKIRATPGLVDLVERYRRAFSRRARRQGAGSRDQISAEALGGISVHKYLCEIYAPSSSTPGRLLLLSAGSRRADEERSPRPAVVDPTPGTPVATDDPDALLARLKRREAERATDVGDLTNYDEQKRATESAGPVADDEEPGPLTFAAYAAAVQGLNWTDFFANFAGQAFVDWLRAQLLTVTGSDGQSLADIVLVDSRTGVTEMGGVCTRVLADMVMTFCAPNQQNLDGSIRIARAARTDTVEQNRGRRLDVVLVPSRLDDRAESDDLLLFQGQFEQREREFPTPIFRFQDDAPLPTADPPRPASPAPRHSFWTLRIPYFPKLSYKEALTFTVDGSRGRILPLPDLQAIYARIGAHVVAHAPRDSALRRRMAGVLSRELPEVASRVVLSYFADGADHAARIRRALQERDIDVGEDLTHHGNAGGVASSIGEARALIAVVTPAALASNAFRDELRFARQHGTFCALVVADEIAAPPGGGHAAYRLSELQQLAGDLLRPRAVDRAPNLTPGLPAAYVERTELLRAAVGEILPALPSAGVLHVALWGLPGHGKTVIAAAVCHRGEVYDAFPGGVLWVPMGEYAELAPEPEARSQWVGRTLARLYASLTGEQIPFKDEQEARKRLAERLQDHRVLWVLDDLADARDVALLPELAVGARIITTRDRAVARALRATVIGVGPMTPDEARSVLGVGDSGSDPAMIGAVVDHTFGWPMLLALARDQLAADVGRGVAPPAALAGLEATLARHGVAAFDPWVSSDRQRVSSLIAASVRRLGPALERFGLPALLRLVRGESPDAWSERWPVVDGGPAESERAELARRLGDLALIDAQGHPDPTLVRYLAASIGAARADATTGDRHVKSAEDRSTSADLSKTIETLRAGRVSDPPGEVKALVRRLKEARYFGYARQYLGFARQSTLLVKELTPWLGQQHALCTYKDPDLPADERVDRALAILDKTDALERSDSSETLGIAGAIHKAKWMFDGQRVHLERSLAYYRRGFRHGDSRDVVLQRIAEDSGYTAINAAYVLDLLAGAARDLPAAQRAELRAEARQLRDHIVVTLSRAGKPQTNETGKPWWFLVTLAEACFGLGVGVDGRPVESWYEQARYWIREALVTDHALWEYESFARQLSSIARLQYGDALGEDSAAMRVLRVLLTDEIAVESVQVGKVGLALSGGGFRAALFHIGVLARLAEFDLLRRVEVLSCVSGGSIIGAYYYLEVKTLLESKSDEAIGRDDYVAIVQSIADQFLAGVQEDLRNRLLADFRTNVRSMFVAADAQTRRLGDLIETHLYARAAGGAVPAEVAMRNLKITPHGAPADFTPKLDNWRRRAKVPILVLNATTLNTGHNWQFTATWMGEPPAAVNADIDVNDQLPRVYYEGQFQAPAGYRDFRLGHAVAASAAVPILFPPLELPGLYEGHDVVQLSDGGVHDNQGIAGVLEQDCTVLLVSDASGQLQTTQAPTRWRIGVGRRTNDVLMERVRGAEYRELVARTRAGLVQGLMFVHLTEGLEGTTVRWAGSQEPVEPPDDPDAASVMKEEWRPTDYGVPRAWQRRVARLRTDLDAFSDREAYALMWSGYQMTGRRVRSVLPELVKGKPETWRFLAVKDQPPRDLEDALTLGDRLFGKVWCTSAGLRAVTWTALALAVLNLLGWTHLGLRCLALRAETVAAEILLVVAALVAVGVAATGLGLVTWALCKGIAKARGHSGPVAMWLLLAAASPALRVHRAVIRPLYLERGAMNPRPSGKRGRVTLAVLVLAMLLAGLLLAYLAGGFQPIAAG